MIDNPIKTLQLKNLKNNSPVIISDLEHIVNINPGPAVSFQEMIANRKPYDADDMRKNLYSKSGHEFTNFGVSTVLTINLDNQDYLIFEDQKIKDKPNILKHISGYVESEYASTPQIAAGNEINEEFLPLLNNGNHLRVLRAGNGMNSDFSDKLDYDSREFIITANPLFDFYGLQRDILIKDQQLGFSPRITYHTQTNNAQLLYEGHIIVPKDIRSELNRFNSSIDKPNFGSKCLETHYTEDGIVLGRLEDRKLTGEIYELNQGKIVKIDMNNRVLSDAFAPYENDLIIGTEIDFRTYIQNQ